MGRAALATIALLCALTVNAQEVTWRDAYSTALEFVRDSAASQQRVDTLRRSDDALYVPSSDVRLRADFANQRIRELERKQFRRASEIAELQERLRTGALTKLELVPLLEDMLEALAAFIASDLPFEAKRRTERVNWARDLLADHRATLERKLLNVFELYRSEIDAGTRIDFATGRIRIDDAERAVDLLRAGRIALYAMTPDRQWAGTWDRAERRWKTLSAEDRRALAAAFAMHEHGAYTAPLALPVKTE